MMEKNTNGQLRLRLRRVYYIRKIKVRQIIKLNPTFTTTTLANKYTHTYSQKQIISVLILFLNCIIIMLILAINEL
jgi:hypothetical protein